MWGYHQAPGVHEPKDMRMWGCKDTKKHPEYMNLSIYEDARMRGYQQAPRMYEPRIWKCEDTNKQTEYMNLRIRGCEDTRLQTSTHEPDDMRM